MRQDTVQARQDGNGKAAIRAGVLQQPRATRMLDKLNRPLHDLRISVTDRCNFRCTYCMPKEIFGTRFKFLPRSEVLSFEEITRTARLFTQLGVEKLRLTGGEPLVRKGIEELVAQLAGLRTLDGKPLDITLTTNGSMLARKAQALADAGLRRVTVSLDALDDTVFQAMNDIGFPVAKVLDGIEAAREAGLAPIKVNVVVKRGTNDQEILPVVRHFIGTGITPRFIEFMDVGNTNGWCMDEVLPGADVVQRISSEFPLVRLQASTAGETAQRWGFAGRDGRHDPMLGEVGVICSVTRPFCQSCNRARLSADGKIYTCLFATSGHDLRQVLRSGATDDDVLQFATDIWHGRSDRYSEIRASLPPSTRKAAHKIEMHYIGG